MEDEPHQLSATALFMFIVSEREQSDGRHRKTDGIFVHGTRDALIMGLCSTKKDKNERYLRLMDLVSGRLEHSTFCLCSSIYYIHIVSWVIKLKERGTL